MAVAAGLEAATVAATVAGSGAAAMAEVATVVDWVAVVKAAAR